MRTIVVVAFGACLCLSSNISAQESTAAKFLKFWEPMFGKWTVAAEVKGQKVKMVWQLKPAASKEWAIISTEAPDGTPSSNGLAGYCPEHKCWKDVSFGKGRDGKYSHAVMHVHFDITGSGRLRTGTTMTAKRREMNESGDVTEVDAKWTFTTVDKDKISFTIEPSDGEETEWVLTRIRK